MRFSAACMSASVMTPRDTWRAMLRSMVARALSTASFFTSFMATSIAGQRDHMGDAVAHLAGADDADRLDAGLGHGILAFARALHVTAGFSRF